MVGFSPYKALSRVSPYFRVLPRNAGAAMVAAVVASGVCDRPIYEHQVLRPPIERALPGTSPEGLVPDPEEDKLVYPVGRAPVTQKYPAYVDPRDSLTAKPLPEPVFNPDPNFNLDEAWRLVGVNPREILTNYDELAKFRLELVLREQIEQLRSEIPAEVDKAKEIVMMALTLESAKPVLEIELQGERASMAKETLEAAEKAKSLKELKGILKSFFEAINPLKVKF